MKWSAGRIRMINYEYYDGVRVGGTVGRNETWISCWECFLESMKLSWIENYIGQRRYRDVKSSKLSAEQVWRKEIKKGSKTSQIWHKNCPSTSGRTAAEPFFYSFCHLSTFEELDVIKSTVPATFSTQLRGKTKTEMVSLSRGWMEKTLRELLGEKERLSL